MNIFNLTSQNGSRLKTLLVIAGEKASVGPNAALRYKQMSFLVNVENCANFETNNENEETTAKNKTDVNIAIIAAVSVFIVLVLAVVVILVCRAGRKKLSEENRKEIKKTDENSTYGT